MMAKILLVLGLVSFLSSVGLGLASLSFHTQNDGWSNVNLLKEEKHLLKADDKEILMDVGFLNVSACVFECLERKEACFSLNIARRKNQQGHLKCELLNTDKYRKPGSYKPNPKMDHYRISVSISA